MRKLIAIAMGVFILVGVNWTIYKREKLIEEGKIVLLELAPVDPRSIMQGDYMILNYQIAREVFFRDQFNPVEVSVDDKTNEVPSLIDGVIIVQLDQHGVAKFKRIEKLGAQAKEGEVKLRYRIRNETTQFATNAFFFQEGTAEKYQQARYGEFRVADNGDMILTKMRDAQFVELNQHTQLNPDSEISAPNAPQ